MLRRFLSFGLYKNPALKALLVADGLLLTAEAMLVPIYAVFVQEVGGDILDVGITAAALAFGSGLASLFGGSYADKLRDKKPLIILCYAVTAVGFLLFTTVESVLYLAAIQAALGLVRAFAEPAFDALYSVNLDKHKEAEGWAAWEAMAYFVTAAGALVGAAIVAASDFDTLFVVMAALCAASAVYLSRIPSQRFRKTMPR